MQHFIFNLADGNRQRAASFLHAKRWVFDREERHRDAIAPGDLALVFVALTREFVGRAKLETAFLDPIPSDAATSGPPLSGVLLGDVEEWTTGVPLNIAVQRIDPTASNPYVQSNAAGFRAGVVQITVSEYDIVVALHDEAGEVAEQKQRAKTLEAAKLLRKKLGVALRHREQSLSYQWEIIFGTPHDFRRVGDVLAELEFLPLESLSLAAANDIGSGLEQVTSVLERMERFSTDHPASPVAKREQLIKEIHQAADALCTLAGPWVRRVGSGG